MSRRLHILSVGRHKALAGLAWRDTPGDTPTEVREQVRSAAEAYRSRFGLLVEATRTEVGMVPELAQKEARNAYSAAAWLATAVPTPLLYIESLASGAFWIVHTASGYVDPRSDEVCGEDDARSLIDGILDTLAMHAGQGVRVVMGGDRKPSSAMLDRLAEIEHRTFAELVRGVPPPPAARIRQLVGITPTAILGAISLVVLAVAAWGGFIAYSKWEEQRAFEARRAAIAAQEAEAMRLRNETELRMKLAVDMAVQQDTATPPPDDVLRACADRVQALGRYIGGWRVVGAECDILGTSVKITVSAPSSANEIGTAATLLTSASERGMQSTINPANGQATLVAPLAAPVVRAALKPTQLPAWNPVLRSLLSRLQIAKSSTRAITFSMTAPAPRPVTYIDPELEDRNDASKFKPVPPERTYLKGSVRLDGTSAWGIEALSLDYPFLSLTKASITPGPSGLNWHVEADYVSNP